MTNFYRTGSHNARNIYRAFGDDRATDEHVAVAFVPEFARFVVRTLNLCSDHRPAYEALSRIAEAHRQNIDAAGGVSGFCGECDQIYPCPTRRWATLSVTDPFAAWDNDNPHDQPDAP